MVGQDVELQAREQELYTVLQDWPDIQAITVGGYAASAWSFPRFSNDLDFIVSEADAPKLHDRFKGKENLPFFSKVSLCQTAGFLRRLNFDVSYADILRPAKDA